jgi:hypothetical protein
MIEVKIMERHKLSSVKCLRLVSANKKFAMRNGSKICPPMILAENQKISAGPAIYESSA